MTSVVFVTEQVLIYPCGCSEIPEGFCDCDGSVLDAIGACGGDCEDDYNSNNICDDQEIYGCYISMQLTTIKKQQQTTVVVSSNQEKQDVHTLKRSTTPIVPQIDETVVVSLKNKKQAVKVILTETAVLGLEDLLLLS